MSHPEQKIRVLIVDDHPVVRMGLSTMLQRQEDILVVDSVDSGQEAMGVLRRAFVDLALLDLRMPGGMSGIETIRSMRAFSSSLKILVLSSFELDEEIHQAVAAGAHGYLSKGMSSDEILHAIRSVHNGLPCFPKRIADRLKDRQSRRDLSRRELEVLEFVCKGFTNKEIAGALHLSQFTVRNHLNSITSKLEATDRTEAAFIALQTGIVSMPG